MYFDNSVSAEKFFAEAVGIEWNGCKAKAIIIQTPKKAMSIEMKVIFNHYKMTNVKPCRNICMRPTRPASLKARFNLFCFYYFVSIHLGEFAIRIL